MSGNSGKTIEKAVFTADQTRNLQIYILPGRPEFSGTTAGTLRQYNENVYVPQGIAAYFPARFSRDGSAFEWSFSNTFSYRIVSHTEQSGGILLYGVEARGTGEDPGYIRQYTVTFDRGSLEAPLQQPAMHALELGVEKSGIRSGTARLESLKYDSQSGRFTAEVIVGGA
ncbi:hypothetical protein [Breznakiella homolactica]|uniref:Uncharacterized protein n=1 Tax=Breznakiella homolactica TaxID=2798577 RepID=A0A7T8BAW0_9SPIR|nr:hypothetical protein [Breznakiella homolactica]QQO09425.1 hypothetical protein JFL75_00435 [Breznakiella homolactica]